MSSIGIKQFFTLILSTFILNEGYAIEEEHKEHIKAIEGNLTPRQIIKYLLTPPEPDDKQKQSIESIMVKMNNRDYVGTTEEAKKDAEVYFQFSSFICGSTDKLKSYLKLIHILILAPTKEETEIISNYLEAATHLEKIYSALETLDKHPSTLEYLPEFLVKIPLPGPKKSDEADQDLDDEIEVDTKIYNTLYGILEAKFLETLKATTTISNPEEFISTFLNKKENQQIYKAIQDVHQKKIDLFWEQHIFNKQQNDQDNDHGAEFDFAEVFGY